MRVTEIDERFRRVDKIAVIITAITAVVLTLNAFIFYTPEQGIRNLTQGTILTAAFVLVYYLPMNKYNRALFYSTFAIVTTIPFVIMGGPNLLVRHYQLYLALATITLYFDTKLYLKFAIITNLVYLTYCIVAPVNFLINKSPNIGYMISLAIYLNTSIFILYMCTKWGTQLIQTANETNEKIKKYSEELELLVDERTQDLNLTNTTLNLTNEELGVSIQQLQETQAQLILSEKMASLGTLVSGMAHELNTPLGVAITLTSYLERELLKLKNESSGGTLTISNFQQSVDEVKRVIDTLKTSLQRSADLVSQFKKIETSRSDIYSTELPLGEYINIVWKSIGREMDTQHIQVIKKVEDDFTVNGEPADWIIVLSNLLMNAIEHSIGNQSGWIEIKASYEEGRKCIEITDSGKGIDETSLTKIFDPFFTTARDKGHIGLGLQIVYNIVVQKFKGEIKAYNHEKKTRIMIKLGE